MSGKGDYSHLFSSDPQYIDSLYDQYQNDPSSLEESWLQFFKGFEYGLESQGEMTDTLGSKEVLSNIDDQKLKKEFNVFRLIQSFRARGHLLSDTNPVRPRVDRDARISLRAYDLHEEDLDKKFICGNFVGLGEATLNEIYQHMDNIYCKKIGIEYMHSNNTDMRRWVRNQFEARAHKYNYPNDKKIRILQKLNEAQVFENFLQTKFTGQKRFSLEGGESTIPALDFIINHGAELGAKEFVIGMAHRGRLNVLANIIGKTYEFIFDEFESGKTVLQEGSGDVKYHLGYTAERKTFYDKDVYIKIMHNPSHLEAVAPVTQGYARAQVDIAYRGDKSKIIPIVLHGDAAVAGQGVVYETLQMCKLKAYETGGTIHFVINNQIGFTTDFSDGRSSQYSTSVARTLDIPIIHVNGDHPEDVVFAVELATEYRQKFHEDVFIDMVCYRKYGHNEGDEPKYTQPHLYGLIKKHKNPRELYLDQLKNEGELDASLLKKIEIDFKNLLSNRFNSVKQKDLPSRQKGPHTEWKDLRWSTPNDFLKSPETAVSKEELDKIVHVLSTVPENFKPLKKAEKLLTERKSRYSEDRIDWALAELMAYGSILNENNHIRFSGQDVVRGTFSHRHAKIFDEVTNESYSPLANLKANQGTFNIYNSHLSEYGVLGFEYGYSLGTPRALNIWEAQFGDFANAAQIIIDQFIVAAETKWSRMTGLIMLLPHGFEGQGPEHSSARIERYLQLCADNNMIVANCTTPANFFHLLRRQIIWPFRKPLVVFTPKSMLRSPLCESSKEDFFEGNFKEVLYNQNEIGPQTERVIFSFGKVYFDLLNYKNENNLSNTALIRLEQLYPFPEQQLKEVLSQCSSKVVKVWVQEEPKNQGAFGFLSRYPEFYQDLLYSGRKESSSPATGNASIHKEEQINLTETAFKIKKGS